MLLTSPFLLLYPQMSPLSLLIFFIIISSDFIPLPVWLLRLRGIWGKMINTNKHSTRTWCKNVFYILNNCLLKSGLDAKLSINALVPKQLVKILTHLQTPSSTEWLIEQTVCCQIIKLGLNCCFCGSLRWLCLLLTCQNPTEPWNTAVLLNWWSYHLFWTDVMVKIHVLF